MRSGNGSNPTMKDVGAAVGVSATVVSSVLSGRGNIRVKDETARRVLLAAQELGYHLNVTAKQFRERQTMTIGVLHGAGFPRPKFHGHSQYFAALFDGIINGAFDAGYAITLCPKLLEADPTDAMTDGRFDGLVWYSSPISGRNREILDRCPVPVVTIHTPSSEFGNKFPSVRCDNNQGIGLAVDHLIEIGHRRIGFIFNVSDQFDELQIRRDAFVQHMNDRGLSTSNADLLITDDLDTRWARGFSHTALIAASDGVAAKVLEHCARGGISVPRDLSVVGFDSTDFCTTLKPALSSIHQPLTFMGSIAVELLVRSIRGDTSGPTDLVIPCGLDLRGSTTSI